MNTNNNHKNYNINNDNDNDNLNINNNVATTKHQCNCSSLRKPSWIRNKLLSPDEIVKVKKILTQGGVPTVCDEASCPNRTECFGRGTATFIIMGKICTRNCRFCDVTHGKPLPLDATEPERLAITVKNMGLKYVVITSVCRDDLADDGAEHFMKCIKSLRLHNPDLKVEILAPDFRKNIANALDILAESLPDVFAHNIEVVPSLYKTVTPSRDYALSLKLLKEHSLRFPTIPTKSSIMVGLGETEIEIHQTLQDLRNNNVSRVTIGQYLQPKHENAKLQRYYTPEEFVELGNYAKSIGFSHVASGPMVRSSYYAEQMVD